MEDILKFIFKSLFCRHSNSCHISAFSNNSTKIIIYANIWPGEKRFFFIEKDGFSNIWKPLKTEFL